MLFEIWEKKYEVLLFVSAKISQFWWVSEINTRFYKIFVFSIGKISLNLSLWAAKLFHWYSIKHLKNRNQDNKLYFFFAIFDQCNQRSQKQFLILVTTSFFWFRLYFCCSGARASAWAFLAVISVSPNLPKFFRADRNAYFSQHHKKSRVVRVCPTVALLVRQ